jgi:arylsulfatase
MLVRWPKDIEAPRGQVLDQPVELRDVLPTFLQTAGVDFKEQDFDGRSLLQLIRGQTEKWRPFIDLEHSVCYGGSESWNALTDGRMKYVFYAESGREELFDLQKDPREVHDLAPDPQQQDALHAWRGRMVEHLSKRGEGFVKDGKLVAPRRNVLYSPLFPQDADKTETQGKANKDRKATGRMKAASP